MPENMYKKLNRWFFKIELEDVQDRNVKGELAWTQCLLCGAQLHNTGFFVQLLDTYDLVSSTEDLEDSLGFFPVCVCCKERLPDIFVFPESYLKDMSDLVWPS